MQHQQVFTLPSRELLNAFIRWFSIVLSAYFAVYYPCNFYAARQTDYYHLYAAWELSIPLVPSMIVVYLSYVAIFGVLLFVIKTPDAIRALAYSMLAMLAISGIIFLAFPGHLGYSRTADVPGFGYLFQLVHDIDRPHNLFPSLHVSFASLCVFAMIHQTRQRWFHLSLMMWFTAVCASVILVHQHHLFDVASALILSRVVHQQVYLRMVEKPFENRTLVSGQLDESGRRLRG
jgi:membrane-associated phospholipid phosphatase